MSVIRTEPLGGSVAWSGDDLQRDRGWARRFEAAQIAELETAARAALASGRPVEALVRADFPLPALAPALAATAAELERGRGIVLWRGLPVDRYTPAELAAIFWGIGTHLGRAIPQNARGDLVGHVRDEGRSLDDPHARGYQTRVAQSLHVDRCDVVALLCRRKARAGGVSRAVSSVRIHDELLRRAPWLLGVLYRPFAVDLRGEERPGEPPVYYRPVFSFHRGVLSCGANATYIRDGQRKIGAPLSPVECEALDTFYALAEELVLSMDLEPGDIQFLNSYVTLHDRSGYDDFDEPDRKRHMLRLWLQTPHARPLAPDFGTYRFERPAAASTRNGSG